MTQTGLSLGTPQYMAPEQAMGEKSVDARADIYALGAVTYEMLAGEPPFTGPTVQAILARVMTTSPPFITALRESVSPQIDAALRVALAKLAADRFGSARLAGCRWHGDWSRCWLVGSCISPPQSRCPRSVGLRQCETRTNRNHHTLSTAAGLPTPATRPGASKSTCVRYPVLARASRYRSAAARIRCSRRSGRRCSIARPVTSSSPG